MDTILNDPAGVRGIIYCVEHAASGKKYVGQTRSHRLNHGRYRPFGAEGRFRDHVSCARCNTKTDQCSALYNDIRLHGGDAFKFNQLEECDVEMLDQREKHWIAELSTLYPSGYNLTDGGRKVSIIKCVGVSTPLNPVGPRGGCKSRSAETRAKMAERSKVFSNQQEVRDARSVNASEQHALQKIARFEGVSIDANNLDQYIFTKGKRVFVRIGDRDASFTGVGTTQEENIKRAKEFLTSLTTATLPNCSGNP
jgi:hypothetical protein